MVSVDVEEWADALVSGVPRRARRWLSRGVEPAVDRLLAFLDRHRASATFFVHGHLARRRPCLVRRMSERHEIACRGDLSGRPGGGSEEALVAVLCAERDVVASAAGRAVHGYRDHGGRSVAAGAARHALLARAGFLYDASSPRRRASSGGAFRVSEENSVWAIPPTGLRVPGVPIAVAGRLGLRLLPGRLLADALGRESRLGRVPHLVLQPWSVGAPSDRFARHGPIAPCAASSGPIPAGRVDRKLALIFERWRGVPVGEIWRELDATTGTATTDADGAAQPRQGDGAAGASEKSMTSVAARR